MSQFRGRMVPGGPTERALNGVASSSSGSECENLEQTYTQIISDFDVMLEEHERALNGETDRSPADVCEDLRLIKSDARVIWKQLYDDCGLEPDLPELPQECLGKGFV